MKLDEDEEKKGCLDVVVKKLLTTNTWCFVRRGLTVEPRYALWIQRTNIDRIRNFLSSKKLVGSLNKITVLKFTGTYIEIPLYWGMWEGGEIGEEALGVRFVSPIRIGEGGGVKYSMPPSSTPHTNLKIFLSKSHTDGNNFFFIFTTTTLLVIWDEAKSFFFSLSLFCGKVGSRNFYV